MFPFKRQTYSATVLRLLILAFAITGCRHNQPSPAEQDEQRLRDYWKIPRSIALVSLASRPQGGGTFGREGLRIYAVFQFSPEQFQQYRKTFREADWQPLPIAADIFDLRDGPSELPRSAANGIYICDLSHRQAGPQATPQTATNQNASAQISQFHLAFLNSDDATLHAVYKSYH